MVGQFGQETLQPLGERLMFMLRIRRMFVPLELTCSICVHIEIVLMSSFLTYILLLLFIYMTSSVCDLATFPPQVHCRRPIVWITNQVLKLHFVPK